MSTYTRFELMANLKKCVQADVVTTLRALAAGHGVPSKPDHPYFDFPGSAQLFQSSGFGHPASGMRLIESAVGSILVVSRSLPNSLGDFKMFLDWIVPSLEDSVGIAGFIEAEMPGFEREASIIEIRDGRTRVTPFRETRAEWYVSGANGPEAWKALGLCLPPGSQGPWTLGSSPAMKALAIAHPDPGQNAYEGVNLAFDPACHAADFLMHVIEESGCFAMA